jgi:anthranilate phosphoribosyltransferase
MLQLGLPVAGNWDEVDEQLDRDGLSYLPLRHFCPPLHEMMQLRPLLGLRSPVNTLARLINPLQAACSIQSVFHPAYCELHQRADLYLEQPRSVVFKGDSGEAEIKPQADTRLKLLVDGQIGEQLLPRSIQGRVNPVDLPAVAPLRDLWRGEAEDGYGLDSVLATVAATLLILQPGQDIDAARERASALWRQRDQSSLS